MTKFFLIATSLLSIATPVIAKDARPATAASSDVATGTPATTPTTRYCTVDMITGSHIPHKTCKTRAEWLQDGFDPLAKQ